MTIILYIYIREALPDKASFRRVTLYIIVLYPSPFSGPLVSLSRWSLVSRALQMLSKTIISFEIPPPPADLGNNDPEVHRT